MPDVLFCSDVFWDERGEEIVTIDPTIEVVRLVGDEHVTPSDLDRITIAFQTPDLWRTRITAFMGAAVRCPNLRWMQTAAAGTDHTVFDQLRSNGVRLTTGVGTTAPAIAQTVMLYVLALSRDLPRLGRAQAEHRWAPNEPADLEGRRLGIVGFGAIGEHVARLAEPFGMEVIGLRRRPDPAHPVTTWPTERFGELLEWADVVVVCAPLTDETRGMFDAGAFARMRPGSWFINVGRGQIVDEDALVQALLDGHLGGAGLDVFATEPLPSDSPIWDLPNVIVTPHCSGDTDSSARRVVELTIENFRRHTAGEPLINLLD
jgi:phosphoglycerate dehydrogenase-like enzyme